MLITFERKVPQSSYTSQNDHKSKGYPSAAAFTDKGDLGTTVAPKMDERHFFLVVEVIWLD